MLPRRVARYLSRWGYDLESGSEFGINFLTSRVPCVIERDGETSEAFGFASLCAVPHLARDELYEDYEALLSWLRPDTLTNFVPSGSWLPRDVKTFTSEGVVLASHYYSNQTDEAQPRPWQFYLVAARNGYFESGRQAGFLYRERIVFPFAPLISWIQRFTALIQEAKMMQPEQVDYSLVLNLPRLERAALNGFGRGWPEPCSST